MIQRIGERERERERERQEEIRYRKIPNKRPSAFEIRISELFCLAFIENLTVFFYFFVIGN